jgi:hypothetical protein
MVRKTVSIRVDGSLWEEFKRLAYAKHGDFYGAISHELEQAIQVWLAQHTQNHTKQLAVNKINPQPRVFQVFGQVKAYLKEKYGYAALVQGQQIPKVHLTDAIMVLRGPDYRTVNKWMGLFLKYKLIKWIAGELYEVV